MYKCLPSLPMTTLDEKVHTEIRFLICLCVVTFLISFHATSLHDPSCTCGFGEKTGLHVICECPKFSILRLKILGNCEISSSEIPKLGSIIIDRFLLWVPVGSCDLHDEWERNNKFFFPRQSNSTVCISLFAM